MDFSFSPEQDQLRAQARSFLEKRFPAPRIAELASSPEGWDRPSWKELAGLGWTGASIAEADGGAGLGLLEEAIIFEELGRALYPGPYFATVGLALPALAAAPELLRRVASGDLTATLAWREPGRPVSLRMPDAVATEARCVEGRWSLRGEKHLVPDAGTVDAFVVLARTSDGVALFLVERRGPGAGLKDGRPQVAVPDTVDATRRLGRVTLDHDEGTLLVAPPAAAAVIARTRSRALTALALEAVGIGAQALTLAVAHAKTRQQFGKPIGAYQAVSHKLADTYVEVELARSLAYWAAWCIAEADGQAELAAIAAKAHAAEAAVAACERAIQVHGGMGFTWDHPLHRYYKRALWIEAFEGSGAAHRAEIARSLFDDRSIDGH
jgi:alkylation response protein AidB-like acyl-CoA dehydrogenase